MTTQQSLFNRTTGSAAPDARLSTIRRFYFYLVALISSTAALIAIDGLVRALADAWLGSNALYTLNSPGYVRRTIAESAGMLIVSVPIFLVHWELIRRRFGSSEERSAAMRKFYLYAASAIALGWLLVRGTQLLQGISVLAFGGSVEGSSILPSDWLYLGVMMVVSGALFAYWQHTARTDGDYGFELSLAATWRRIFFAGTALVGLAMLLVGASGIFSTLIEGTLDSWAPSVSNAWFATQMGAAVTYFLIGAVTARWAWTTWQAISANNADEEFSTVKRIFLYVGTLGAAIATLVPVSFILRDLLLWLFRGMSEPWYELVDGQALALGFLPAAVTLWVAFRDYLHAQEAAPAISPVDQMESNTIRRIYYYVVAATGLTLVWLGSVRVVQVGLDQLFEASTVATPDFWQLPLATGLSLLIVGVPVWLLHWRSVQKIARREDEAGLAERSSLPRRIYLYGVAFVGAILILSYLAQVIYRLFLYGMGGNAADNFTSLLAEDIARSLIAAVLWVVHLKALRDDGALGADGAPFLGGGSGDGRRRDQIERKIDNLEHELIRLRSQLVEINAEEEAMLAQSASLSVQEKEAIEAPVQEPSPVLNVFEPAPIQPIPPVQPVVASPQETQQELPVAPADPAPVEPVPVKKSRTKRPQALG